MLRAEQASQYLDPRNSARLSRLLDGSVGSNNFDPSALLEGGADTHLPTGEKGEEPASMLNEEEMGSDDGEDELDQDEDMLDICGTSGRDRTLDGIRGAMTRINSAMVNGRPAVNLQSLEL